MSPQSSRPAGNRAADKSIGGGVNSVSMLSPKQAFDRILDRLRDNGRKVRESRPGQARAQCPAHDDHNPSLSITKIEGQALLWCFAGCATSDVLAALDLGMSDLFDNRRNATYGYKDGRQVRRWYGDNGKRQFSQFGVRGTTAVLYRLEEVKAAVAAGEPVYVCEGEKDCHAIEALGAVATTAPMGAANFGKVDVSPLYGANVIAIRHKDEAGDAWAVQVHEKLDGEAASFQFRQAKIGNDAADHIAAELGLADFEPADIEDENARVRRLLPRINWHALWADHAEEEWILYPLVPVRRLVALYSPPKIGKSLLALEVAVGISREETVLGYTPSKRWRVLYVDFENDPRGDIRERLQAMGCGPDDLDHLDYLSFPTLAALDSERGALELLAAIAAYGSEIVIIDTISRAVGGEENSNDTWLDFYRYTGLGLKQAGVAMLRLDHTGKDEAKGQRGGSAKSGDVDAVWRLTKIGEDRLRLECTDARFPLETKSVQLLRHADPLEHTVETLGKMTSREEKIRHIIALADAARLPSDTSREDIATFARERNIKARTDVFSEVVKLRKLSPTIWDSPSESTSPPPSDSVGTAGDSPPENVDSERKNAVPDPWGQPGTDSIGLTVPVPSSPGGDGGTAGQTVTAQANEKEISA